MNAEDYADSGSNLRPGLGHLAGYSAYIRNVLERPECQPLERETQRELLARYATLPDGREKMELRNRLWLANLKLVPPCVRSLLKNNNVRSWVKLTDLIQAGNEGLRNALNTYEAEKGSFGHHAFHWIRAKAMIEIKNIISTHGSGYNVNIAKSCGERVSLLETDLESMEAPERGLSSEDLLKHLPNKRQNQVLAARFKGQTLEEIGVDLGLTRERVRQIEEVAISVLRDALDHDRPFEFIRSNELREFIFKSRMRAGKYKPPGHSKEFPTTAFLDELKRRGEIKCVP